MKVALAQLNYTIGDFEGNTVKIIDCIGRAKREGADLVVFCEQAISGAPAYDLLNKVTFLERCEEALVEIASACDDIAVLVGLPLQAGGHTISAAAYICNRRIVRYIGKRNIAMRDEFGHIFPSEGCEYISIKGHKVAVVVGEDLLTEQEYGEYADTIVNLGAEGYYGGIVEKRYETLRQRSFTTGKNVVFVNAVGGQTDIVFDGFSSVFNGKGEPVALLAGFEEDFAVVDLTTDNAPLRIPVQNKTRNVYRAITLGLRDYFRKNDFRRACLGLSGGIDSAVVAAIAVEVLGHENVRVIMLPSKFSSDHSVEDALALAENLGIEYNVIPITEAYESIVASLKPVFGSRPFDVAEENIQARIRCTMLMGLSNKLGYVLLNTSNKSEEALGYGTLYGDTTGSISILGDLYKTEVYDLARYINREREIIPEHILIKEPSAELRPDQKDSDYLPPYDVVDAILYRMIEEGQHREEIVNAGFDTEVVQKIYRMIVRNEHKRYQFCPTLRMSTCTFGEGRVMPLTSKYGF